MKGDVYVRICCRAACILMQGKVRPGGGAVASLGDR